MATTKKSDLKAGWKSTEFILSAVTALLGLAIAGGFIDIENGANATDKIAGLICSALAAVGYSVSRATVKKAAEENK